jgi:hypothetical protein
MSKVPLAAAALCAASCFSGPLAAADLTALETRWLGAAFPVLHYARSLALPVDIIVQPQARPGDVPLAMGFDGGRCKLVLSLRGNPGAEAQLAGVAPHQQDVLIEAMAAHEIGHCWRHVQGAWHVLPAGFIEVSRETGADPAMLAASTETRASRREEAYADLAALAWTRQRHPAEYARVHVWLARLRQDPPVARGSHDTRSWVALARDGRRFGSAGQPFDDALPPWRDGLLEDR